MYSSKDTMEYTVNICKHNKQYYVFHDHWGPKQSPQRLDAVDDSEEFLATRQGYVNFTRKLIRKLLKQKPWRMDSVWGKQNLESINSSLWKFRWDFLRRSMEAMDISLQEQVQNASALQIQTLRVCLGG